MTDLACPVAACPGRRRDTSMLMCWPCWRQVPKLLQRAVWDAFGAWQRHPSVESVAKLREEQNRAVKSVEARRSA